MGKIKDIIGQRFGKLLVIKFAFIKNKNACWQCICDCGNNNIIMGLNLKNGNTKSCGCIRKEYPNALKHGFRHTRFYTIWTSIRARCNNFKHSNYKYYGGRGIKCLWKSFEEFKNNMYESYLDHIKKFGEKNTTIDRINNNKNYSKENCKWATLMEQAQNKRNNFIITFQNKTQCLSAWAKEYKIHPLVLWKRIKESKWPIKKSLIIPIKIRK